jgi:hypothetical protein
MWNSVIFLINTEQSILNNGWNLDLVLFELIASLCSHFHNPEFPEISWFPFLEVIEVVQLDAWSQCKWWNIIESYQYQIKLGIIFNLTYRMTPIYKSQELLNFLPQRWQFFILVLCKFKNQGKYFTLDHSNQSVFQILTKPRLKYSTTTPIRNLSKISPKVDKNHFCQINWELDIRD